MRSKWLGVARLLSLLVLLAVPGCPAPTPEEDAGTDAPVTSDVPIPVDTGGSDSPTDSGLPDTGGTDAGASDAGVATTSPMGIDCTDTCPSFEGRDYVCTFLPGFPTTLGYCSRACTPGDPTACDDTEPGEVYCNTDVGRCVIGCPFAGCPHGMECTFDFDDQPACEPVP